jgi:ribosomal protein S18 acetylase RimI-like enzyme
MKRYCIKKDHSQSIASTLALLKYGNYLRVENVETHPKFRRKGLASKLMQFSLNCAIKTNRIDGLILTAVDSAEANSLYNKLNFISIAEKVVLMNYD